MASSPANSPCEPAFGCTDTAANPVIAASQPLQVADQLGVAHGLLGRRERVQVGESGQVIGIISAAAFSFIVHDPSGIMLRFSATSLSSSRFR